MIDLRFSILHNASRRWIGSLDSDCTRFGTTVSRRMGSYGGMLSRFYKAESSTDKTKTKQNNKIGTFGIEWIYSIAVDITLSLLIYNSLTHLEHPEPHDSTISREETTGIPPVVLPMSDYVFGRQATV